MRVRSLLLLSLTVAGFLWGLAALLALRFEAGDVYAEFSSLRSDPAGSRALFESLASLPGLSVQRNFLSISSIEPRPDSALLFLGVEAGDLDFAERASVERVEASVRSGTRLLIALAPGKRAEVSEKPATTPAPRATPRARKEAKPELPFLSLPQRWGFRTMSAPLGAGPAAADPRSPLSVSVPWRSAFWFRAVSPAWHAVYEREAHRPVVLERALGKGTIVLCSDSSFASNLALLRERRTELLAWLLDGKKNVIFDETHLGVSESPGVAALARRYRLQGFAVGILALALLFLWKNALPFPRPSVPVAAESAVIHGRRAFEGLAAVLSRNVSPSRLLETCAAEWRKTLPRGGSSRIAEIEEVEAIVRSEEPGGRERNPVAGYRRITEALAKKRRVGG